jgi:hypothetical protein
MAPFEGINMKLNSLLLAAVLVTSAVPASAVVISATNLNGNSFVDYSGEGLLALDINASNLDPLVFGLSFSQSEIAAGSVAFNAVINNLMFVGIPELLLDFGGLSVNAGTVQSAFNPGPAGAWSVNPAGGSFLARNTNAPETFGWLVGDPYLTGGDLADWTINTTGLSSRGSYALRVQAVPEPGVLAMMGAGLGLLGFVRRRRKA